METTERVVEAYARYIRKWATIPNIRCRQQFEIDLLAIDPVTGQRYHIESGVSVSGSYSKLTAKPFSSEKLKIRVQTAGQRRTFGYFLERKFSNKNVLDVLADYGFTQGDYTRVIVSWGWEEDVPALAQKHKIELWDFRDLMREIAAAFQDSKVYFTDDTMRTLHLYAHATDKTKKG